MNQIALVDKAIRDIRVTRQRYEGVARVQTRLNGDDAASVSSGETMLPDPFDNFRTQKLDSANITTVTLESGTYAQVPSRFAKVGNLVSVYSTVNKSEWPGEKHPGYSVDNRFGNANRINGFYGETLQHQLRIQALKEELNELELQQIRATYKPRSGRHLPSTARLPRGRGGGYRGQFQGKGHHHKNNGNHLQKGNYQGKTEFHMNPSRGGEKPGEKFGKINPPTHPSSVVLVGNSNYSEGPKFDGFPPDTSIPLPKYDGRQPDSDISIPLPAAQEHASRMYAAQVQQERELREFRANFVENDQIDKAKAVDYSQIPGSLAARAAQIVPATGNLVGAPASNSHRGTQKAHGPQPFVYQCQGKEPDILARAMGQPTFKEMLSQKAAQRLPSIDEMLAGLAAEDAYLARNSGGAQINRNPGSDQFSNPVLQYIDGHQVVYYPTTALPPRDMLPHLTNPTALGSSHARQDLASLQGSLAGLNVEDSSTGQDMLASQSNNQKKTRRGQRNNRGLAQKADSEYARYMDELNEESRIRGDSMLGGDAMSGHVRAQVRFSIQPPSPMRPMSGEGEVEYADVKGKKNAQPDEQEAWSDLMTSPNRLLPSHHLNPAVFDGSTGSFVVPPKQIPHLLAVSRPATESPSVPTGRASAPIRSRPSLLSPIDVLPRQDGNGVPVDSGALRKQFEVESNLIFGEKPGSISSRDTSPAGTSRRSTSGRRLYEK
jgi:hypothetical protein